MKDTFNIVVLGLTITSSWGNGHATTYRSLIKALKNRGHRVLFLERNMPWYAMNRDMPNPPFCSTELYSDIEELKDRFELDIKKADVVIVGSYVPEGAVIGQWITSIAKNTAFYDIDTPVTLSKLQNGNFEYITPELISKYDLYLSFTGGPTLRLLEDIYSSPMARPLYCTFDPDIYYPSRSSILYDLGYIGTYSDDRQPSLEKFLIEPARHISEARFAVAGPQYPKKIRWSGNIKRIQHLSPDKHRNFYNAQRYTLNITRDAMIKAGYSPSVRLFEAAACATPIISDYWEGIDNLFVPGEEIFIVKSTDDVIHILTNISEEQRLLIGERAMRKVLAHHTATHRVEELESYISVVLNKNSTIKV